MYPLATPMLKVPIVLSVVALRRAALAELPSGSHSLEKLERARIAKYSEAIQRPIVGKIKILIATTCKQNILSVFFAP